MAMEEEASVVVTQGVMPGAGLNPMAIGQLL